MSDQDQATYLWNRHELLLDRVQYSTLYHRKRERFFDFWDRAIKGLAIIGGSAAVARLSTSEPDTALWSAAMVTVTSTIGLVFGLAERARRHSDLARQYTTLESEIVETGERDFTESNLNRWDAKVREIESTEPPALRNLVIACQNELAIAHDQAQFTHPLGFLRRATMHFI